MNKLFFFGLLLSTVDAFGLSFPIQLNDVRFDDNSQQVIVNYENVAGKTSLTDSGPVLICVIKRLLYQKYDFINGSERIKKEDLSLLFKASRLLPDETHVPLTKEILAYLSGPEKDGHDLVSAIQDTITKGLKNHQTKFETRSQKKGALAQELEKRLATIKTKLAVLEDDTTGNEEQALINKLSKEKTRIEAQLADEQPEERIEKGSESPAQYQLCKSDEYSRSRVILSNKNIDELLTKVKTVLDKIDERELPAERAAQRTHAK